MKLRFTLCVTLAFGLPSLAFASFSLMSIKSIQCTDAAPTTSVDMVLTTDNSAAQMYPHSAITIGFDYWNVKSPFGDAQAGKFTLQNNPDAENGVISLVDLYAVDSPNASSIVLKPTAQASVFTGTLDGDVETANGWGRLGSHQMNCQVNY